MATVCQSFWKNKQFQNLIWPTFFGGSQSVSSACDTIALCVQSHFQAYQSSAVACHATDDIQPHRNWIRSNERTVKPYLMMFNKMFRCFLFRLNNFVIKLICVLAVENRDWTWIEVNELSISFSSPYFSFEWKRTFTFEAYWFVW